MGNACKFARQPNPVIDLSDSSFNPQGLSKLSAEKNEDHANNDTAERLSKISSSSPFNNQEKIEKNEKNEKHEKEKSEKHIFLKMEIPPHQKSKENTTDCENFEEAAPKHFVEVQKCQLKGEEIENKNDGGNKDVDFVKRGERKQVFVPDSKTKDSEDLVLERFITVKKKKTANDLVFVINALKNHFLFSNLSDFELESIANKMFYCQVNQDEYIFKQGDDANSFFILDIGKMEVLIENKLKRELKKGDCFGELALLYSSPRSASIKAADVSKLWGIDRDTFRKVVKEITTKSYKENRSFIENVKFFQNLTPEQKDAISHVLIGQRFAPNQNIVNEGDQASSFYIIMDGETNVIKNAKIVRQLNKGDSFGEQALYTTNSVRGMSVQAKSECKLLALGRDVIKGILGDQVQVIVFKNIQRWGFEKHPLLSKLTKIQQEKILDAMIYVNYKENDIVIKELVPFKPKIIVLIEGNLNYERSKKTFLTKGTAWCEDFVLNAKENLKFPENIKMTSDGVISEIDRDTFEQLIGGNFYEVLKKNEKSHEKKLQSYHAKIKEDADTIMINDLLLIKSLGKGQFGDVYLVRCKKTRKNLALKVISKKMIKDLNLVKHIEQEKTVLDLANFPFILSFVKSFDDQENLYFLTEVIKGMELFDVIREIGLLGTFDSQFYVASLILSLEYLHQLQVIYRDLKPENIMINEQGYLKLIDMGTAKIIKEENFNGARTFTIIGTPHYMAPEIIAGKGYNSYVDLWSLGVILFEFMCGFVPFGEDLSDPYAIYEEIIKKKEIMFPNYLKDRMAKRLMIQLLNKVPELRLGGSFATLKANQWFEKFDWDGLFEGDLKSPYIPPSDKIISEKEIDDIAKKDLSFLDEYKKKIKN